MEYIDKAKVFRCYALFITALFGFSRKTKVNVDYFLKDTKKIENYIQDGNINE